MPPAPPLQAPVSAIVIITAAPAATRFIVVFMSGVTRLVPGRFPPGDGRGETFANL